MAEVSGDEDQPDSRENRTTEETVCETNDPLPTSCPLGAPHGHGSASKSSGVERTTSDGATKTFCRVFCAECRAGCVSGTPTRGAHDPDVEVAAGAGGAGGRAVVSSSSNPQPSGQKTGADGEQYRLAEEHRPQAITKEQQSARTCDTNRNITANQSFAPGAACQCVHSGDKGSSTGDHNPLSSNVNMAKQTPSRDPNDSVVDAPEVAGDTSGSKHKLKHADSSSSIASQDCPSGVHHVKAEKSLKAKRKKKLGTRRKSGAEVPSEGECDDTSSEHSVSSKPKKKKRPRRYCDIHNPKVPKEASCDATIASSVGSAVPNFNEQQEQKQEVPINDSKLICTCGKSSKRSRSRVRPEPEGGSSHTPSHGPFCDEFDRVIFSNDPIFSDMEFDAKEDAQIRTEMERYHKRSNHPDIFSAAQMVNTNTMLKFAIIGAELQNISGVSLRRVKFLNIDLNILT